MILVFWFLVGCMLLTALVFTLLPLQRPGPSSAKDPRRQMNINLRREQLAELQVDLEQGLIDESEFDQAKKELEIGLLSDIDNVTEHSAGGTPTARTTMWMLTFLLPAFVLTMYLGLGSPQMLDPARLQVTSAGLESVEEMMQKLSERLDANPDDAEGWVMLARSYMITEQAGKAAEAYSQAYKLIGDDPALLADYAEARIVADKFQVNEESDKLLQLALSVNPEEPKVLWVAGFAELARGNGERTLQLWNTLLEKLQPQGEEWLSLKDKIDRVQAAMSQAAMDNIDVIDSKTKAIRVSVTLDPDLQSLVNSNQAIYIYARASNGPRMPLAVAKMKVGDLPFEVTLDDSLAMSPELRLSGFDEVVVTARVSMNGGAIPSSGDLSGKSSKLKLGEVESITVSINEVLP